MAVAVGTLFFYILGALAIFFATVVVSSRRIFRAAVALMAVLGATAGFYFMLGAEFLAGIQFLVYIGGVVVLIVFVVMLTGSLGLMEDNPSLGRQVVAGLGALNFFLPVFGVLQFSALPEISHEAVTLPGAGKIGELLLNYGEGGYVTAFELISVLLLVALIGALVIARKGIPSGEKAS